MNGASQALAPFSTPLSGSTLVEAAAGTGKTHAITDLYLRLVLENGLAVEQILVITFTRAATAELRQRIRGRLREALRALGAEAPGVRPAPDALIERAGGVTRAHGLLDAAVRGMDEAAVHTIHGFCQRVIADHAFAGALPLDREIIADEQALRREVVEDFWRREVAAMSPALAARSAALGPQALSAWLRAPLANPRQRVVSDPGAEPPQRAFDRLATCHRGLSALWPQAASDAAHLLAERETTLDRRRYRADHRERWLARIGEWLESGAMEPDKPTFEALQRFTSPALATATRDGAPPPSHRLFDACTDFVDARTRAERVYGDWERGLRVRLLKYCRGEIGRRKRERAVIGYDDLLTDLQAALAADDGTLADILRQRYPAALIDEFQDTDGGQLEVLRRIYHGTDCPLFLVGDPKQAIYRFRGADVFAYLDARRDVDRTRRLATNWRSTPALVNAVNALFVVAERPFALPGIEFSAVDATDCERRPPLSFDRCPAPALRVWMMRRENPEKPLPAEASVDRLAASTAADIASLVAAGGDGTATIGERAVCAGDIAVLVRSHRQAGVIAAALGRLAVPFARRTQEDVFASVEAEEIERALRATLRPDDVGRVRAALAGPLFGFDGAALLALDQDGELAARWAERLWSWHRQWREHGVLALFLNWVASDEVAARVLESGGGERGLTNFRHLAELLDRAEREGGFGPAALVAWLARRRVVAGGEEREAQIRLERDGDAVQILTVHAAKGLEFPVVYCPFAWHPGRVAGPDDEPAFHDPEADDQPTLWLAADPPAAVRARAALEDLDENLRLLYVALTRARAACVVGWGAINGAGASALAWLLHPPSAPGSDPATALGQHFASLGDDALGAAVDAWAVRAEGAVALESPPADRAALAAVAPRRGTRAARVLDREIGSRLERTSYSALVAGYAGSAGDAARESPTGGGGRFEFPRGAHAGICLHALLERADPRPAARGALAALAREVLPAHGYDIGWADALAEWLGEVFDTPLAALDGDCLATLPARDRLAELQFQFAAPAFDTQRFRACAASHGIDPRALGFASPRVVRGFVHGYIDLVFTHRGRYYLADYKSNWLGASASAYRPERVAAVVGDDGYVLQYLLYAVALHRHLAARLDGYDYQRHFGGVCYLFLRGMSPHHEAGSGVFYDRPEAALIEALDVATGNHR